MVSLGTLIVIVIKARNLPNKVRLGKQNPYATLSYGITKKKTSAIERGGQAPEWDQEFRFEISEEGPAKLEEEAVVGPTGGVSANHAPPPATNQEKVVRSPKLLRVACWADDARDPRIIGEGVVDLDIVLKKGTFDAWVSLENKARPAGEVYLEMTFYSNSSPPPQAINASDSLPALLPGAVVPPNGIGYGGPGLHIPLEPTLPDEVLDNSGRLSVVSQGGGDRRGSRTSLAGSELSSITHYPDADFGPLAQSFSNISLRHDLPPPLPLPPTRPLSQSSSHRLHSSATYHPLPPPSLAQSQSQSFSSRPISTGAYSTGGYTTPMPQPGAGNGEGYDGRTTLYPQYDSPYQTGSHSMGYNFDSAPPPPPQNSLPTPPPLPSPSHSTQGYVPDPYRHSYIDPPPPPQFQPHPTPPHAPQQYSNQPSQYPNELGRSTSTIRNYDPSQIPGFVAQGSHPGAFATQGRNGSLGGANAGSSGHGQEGGSGLQELAKDFYSRDSRGDSARRDSYQPAQQYHQDAMQAPYPPPQPYLPPSNSQLYQPPPPQPSYNHPQQQRNEPYYPPPPQQQQDPYQNSSPPSNRYQPSPAPPPLLPIPPQSTPYQPHYPPPAGSYAGDYFPTGYGQSKDGDFATTGYGPQKEGGNDGSRTPILSPIPTLPPPPPPELGDYLANQFSNDHLANQNSSLSSSGGVGGGGSGGNEGGYYRAQVGYGNGPGEYYPQANSTGDGRFERTNSVASSSYYSSLPPSSQPPQPMSYGYSQPPPPSNPNHSNYVPQPPSNSILGNQGAPTSLYEEHYPSYYPPAPPGASTTYAQNNGNGNGYAANEGGGGYSYGVQQGGTGWR